MAGSTHSTGSGGKAKHSTSITNVVPISNIRDFLNVILFIYLFPLEKKNPVA